LFAIVGGRAPGAAAVDAPLAMVAGYHAFLEAVQREDAAGIRAALMPARGAAELTDLVVEELLVFRKFERTAAARLGAADLGFGLSDAAMDRRFAALARAAYVEGRLAMPDLAAERSPVIGMGPGVAMGFDGTEWRVDAGMDVGGMGAAAYLGASETTGGPPGRRLVAVYRAATAELEAGRITSRQGLEQFIDQGVARADEEFERRVAEGTTVAAEAEAVRAREVVRDWLRAAKDCDAAAMARLMTADGPDARAVVARVAERLAVVGRLDAATRKAGISQPGRPTGELIDQTLARLPSARLLVHGEDGLLRSTAYNRYVATTRPWVQAGFRGPPPEDFVVTRVGGEWRLSAERGMGPAARVFLNRDAAHGGDVELAGLKDLVGRLERGDIRDMASFGEAYRQLSERVKAAANARLATAATEQARRLEAWRQSPEGRAAVERMGAKSSRLQIRLVLGAGEPGEFDEMPDPIGGTIRVSRDIALNETAFASASRGANVVDGSPIVRASLNEAGANQMEWLTSGNVGRRLAIVFEGKVLTAPTIRSPIRAALTIDGGLNGFPAGEVERIVAAINAAK
jgi:hypothetical protein